MSEVFDLSAHPADILTLACAIRDRFTEAKGKALGVPGPYKLGERFDKMRHWVAAAKICKEHNFNPEDYIKAVFLYSERREGPFANQIYGPMVMKALDMYRRTNHDQYARLENPAEVRGGPLDRTDEENKLNIPVAFQVPMHLTEEVKGEWCLVAATLGPDPNLKAPRTLEYFRDICMPVQPWFRIYVYPDDPVVWERFSYPGKKTFARNPDFFKYLNSINPALMQHIQMKPAAEKPGWLYYDNSYD